LLRILLHDGSQLPSFGNHMKLREKVRESTVLLLGAGASKAFGYPTTYEFTNILNKSNLDQKPFLEEIIRLISSKLQINNIIDVETILIELEDLQLYLEELIENNRLKKALLHEDNNLMYKGSLLSNRHTSLLNHTRKLITDIYKLVYKTYWEDPENPQEDYRQTYKQFFDKFTTPLRIFTTNYDLCVERTFWKGNDQDRFSIEDGFTIEIDTTFDIDRLSNSDKPYILYKLHGSLNWRKDPNDERTIHRVNFPETIVGDLSTHVMLFPGEKLIDKFPVKEVYELFRERLLMARFCVIIGFSYRDEEINKLLIDSIERNRNLHIISWNRDPESHLNSLLQHPRFEHYDKPFGIDNLNDFFSMWDKFFLGLRPSNNKMNSE
jgi:hypothetical protein